jgi:hypothetical protein
MAVHENERRLAVLSLAMFVLINAPLNALSSFPAYLQFPRLLAIIAVFVLITMLLRPAVSWKLFLLCLLLVALPEVLTYHRKDNNQYVFSSGQQAMVMDFNLLNGVLVYRYWSPHGMEKMVTDFKAEPATNRFAEMRDGQIFLDGRQITFGTDHKRQPLATSAGVVYLSDEGRGYGFYTFKVIKIPM